MIPPGECMYAGRKRRKPVQKQRPAVGSERSNPSKRHRDRLNAELDHLASLLPFPPDVISKLDKLSVLRLSVSYLRVKSFFQALRLRCPQEPATLDPAPGDGRPRGGSAVLEGRLLLESLNGFALVVSAEGMIFYASATIVDYLGFHQTDVMHQNIYDYIHVDDRQDFSRQLHWAMDPPPAAFGPQCSETADDTVLGRLLEAQEGGAGLPTAYLAFLTRCFVCRVRCLLDSTSGFLTMQFQGKLKFLFGQKKRAPSGTVLPPRLSLFCVVAPVLPPAAAELRLKSSLLRTRPRAAAGTRDGEEERGKLLDGSSGVTGRKEMLTYSCHLETQGPTKPLHWTAGKQDLASSVKLKLEPGSSDPFSVRAQPHGSALPCPFNASGVATFRNPPSPCPPSHSPSAYASRTGRPLRSGDRGQAQPPTSCHVLPGSLEGVLPLHRAQRFAVGGYATEGARLQSAPMPLGAPGHPVLSLDVPIKVEIDAGSEGAADSYLVNPRQVPLKAEQDLSTPLSPCTGSRHPAFAPHLGHSVLGALPPSRATSRPHRELAPLHTASRACPPEPGPSHCLWLRGQGTLQPYPLRYDCRAAGAAPVVKREPLDLPPWAAHSQGGMPGLFPKSALATLMPPRASECSFLP
ncbi:aryl hydrocarbon receptor repressor [Choloepus didactylus]|uniref:aryl hydrocarbon receptor repressor n=1 Tax=Choloepus didactylus TaxID=27675 RepID=UPI00189FDAA8|nr:aryl hydrocarbon receptor repressor [Choloepus didactylus]